MSVGGGSARTVRASRLACALAACLGIALLGGTSRGSAATTQAPTVTLNQLPSPSNNTTPVFSGTASDTTPVVIHVYGGTKAEGAVVSQAQATVSGGAFASGAASPALADGTYTALATQQSSHGGPEGTSNPVTFVVDTAPPAVTLNQIVSPSSDATPVFSGTASDTTPVVIDVYIGTQAEGVVVAQDTATVSGGIFTSGATSPALADGTYTAVATEQSSIGNPAGQSNPVTFTISTTLPELGRCLALGKATGRYLTARCTTTSAGDDTGRYEWSPGPGTAATFTSTSGAAILETVAKARVSCLGTTYSGEYTGPRTATVHMTLTGCELTNRSASKCESSGAHPGEVDLNTLEGRLGLIKGGSKPQAGMAFTPEASAQPYVAQFNCGGTPVSVTGDMIASYKPVDTMTATLRGQLQRDRRDTAAAGVRRRSKRAAEHRNRGIANRTGRAQGGRQSHQPGKPGDQSARLDDRSHVPPVARGRYGVPLLRAGIRSTRCPTGAGSPMPSSSPPTGTRARRHTSSSSPRSPRTGRPES